MARTMLRGSHLGLEPDDLVQEALARVAKRLAEHAVIDNIGGYAFTALRSCFLDALRRKLRKPGNIASGSGEQEELDRARAGESSGASSDIRVLAGQLLDQLDPVERSFLLKVVVEGVAVKTAQEQAGGPPGAPYYVLKQLLARLHSYIGESQ